jgi:NADP-dependent 3-hydroxy acid dehydrogenase YdfG
MTEVRDRVAFITGGANGIGLGIARALAREGVKVAIADVDAVALDRTKAELSAVTGVTTVVLDVRDREAYARAADTVESELGPVTLLSLTLTAEQQQVCRGGKPSVSEERSARHEPAVS